MIAEASKPPVTTIKRPDFTCRVSRGPAGIMLYVQSTALCAYLRGLAGDSEPISRDANRKTYNISFARLRGTTLFSLGDAVTSLLLDTKLDTGHEIRIAEVMTATAAKDYVRDVMSAFSEFVRDYMSALRITGTVTIDETVLRRTAPVEI